MFLQKKADAIAEHATFFQQEAESLKEQAKAVREEEKHSTDARATFFEEVALEKKRRARDERVAFFQEQAAEAKKQKRGLFGFLRRKKGKAAAAKAVEIGK